MTISLRLSVNGNYKCPISYKQGNREVSTIISGRGHSGPNEYHIAFSHGPDVMTLKVGPKEPDNGGTVTALDDSGDNTPPPPHPGSGRGPDG